MYQNIFHDRKNETVYLWDDEKRMISIPSSKFHYAYRRAKGGAYKSLYGDELDKVTAFDERDPSLFESDVSVEMKCLRDMYLDSDEPSKNHHIVVIDIEVSSEGGFPDITKGDKQVTAIALFDQAGNKYHSLVLDPEKKISDSDTPELQTRSFKCEDTLLDAFLTLWEQIQPTVVTGWNTNNFNIPYLYNRIRTILGKQASYRLSPIRIAYQNKFNRRMVVAGISLLDYMELYKKFVGVMKPSWSLANVAKDEELKVQKITYKGSLTNLYKTDIHRYAEYNLVDVKVVVELDKKYDFIHLAQAVCHKGHVPYEWFQMLSRFIDGAILMYLRRNGQVAPNKPIGGREEYEEMQQSDEDGFTGAFVKEPISGLYDWICSADITSLYPSVIMTLNISPEKKLGKIEGWNMMAFQRGEIPVVRVNEREYSAEDFKKMIANHTWSISSNGVVYLQPTKKIVGIMNGEKKYEIEVSGNKMSLIKTEFDTLCVQNNWKVDADGNIYKNEGVGVVPEVLDQWFRERVEYRKLQKKFGDEGDKVQSEFYKRRQLRQKIFLNCFSPDTKVMTKDGVKYITDVKTGDLVYSLNRETGKSDLKPVTRTYEYDYDGDMVQLNSNHIDYLVTPNHKFWVSKLGKREYKNFSWEDAGVIANDKVRRKFPRIEPLPTLEPSPTFENLSCQHTKYIDLAYYARLYGMSHVFRGQYDEEIRVKRIGDEKQGRHTTFVPRLYHINDWMEFMGWYISEGSLYISIEKMYATGNHRGISHTIYIAQEVYHKEVKELLERMRIPFCENARGFSISNDIIYRFLEVNCGEDSATKHIPDWAFQCHPDKLRRLYKSLMMGDGHKRGNCYTTKSVTLKDNFLRLCFHIGGMYAFVRDYDGCYRIQINKTRGRGPTLKSNHRKIVPYKGKVYCVEVQDNHTLLCGRNDKYQWCGQSVYGTLGLPIFRFYDRDNAEAVTISGQEIIRSAEKLVNDMYLTKYKEMSTKPPTQDFVVYIDTDSVTGECRLQYKNGEQISVSDAFSNIDSGKEIVDISGRHFKFPKNMELPYFDESNKLVKYGKVQYIEKHRTRKRVFSIKTKAGKTVKVTEDHSLMVIENGMLVKKTPKNIKPGDKIVSI